MDWANERYVRLYTRDTADWLAMRWEAKALLLLLLRKADRAGVIQVAPGPNRARKIAGLAGMPADVAEPGLNDLLADGCLVESDLGYTFRNFLDAQEATQSDAQRQRESRASRRAHGMVRERITGKDAWVTVRDPITSQNVTECHNGSQRVTPSLAVPSLPSLPKEEEGAPHQNGGAEVWEHYRAAFNVKRQYPSEDEKALISARYRDGYSTEEQKRAIDGVKRAGWHEKNGQLKLEAALKDGDRVENCWRWLEHPPDQPQPSRGRASEADKDWTRPQDWQVDEKGNVVL